MRSKAVREITKEAVSRTSPFSRGQAGARGGDSRAEASVHSAVAKDPDSLLARRGLEPCQHRAGGWHLPSGGSPSWHEVSGAWARRLAERRSAPEAFEDARCEATIRDCRDGLLQAAQGTRALDAEVDRQGSRGAWTGPQGWPRNDPPTAAGPRTEALAGKKCGAFQRSTKSSSSGWRTC
jgi:hypothetical protein